MKVIRLENLSIARMSAAESLLTTMVRFLTQKQGVGLRF
jgi:hypothetical protein